MITCQEVLRNSYQFKIYIATLADNGPKQPINPLIYIG